MVWGIPAEGHAKGERWTLGHVPLVALVVALVGCGFFLPEPLKLLLDRAVNVVLMR